jgi:hypothetical protein
MAWRLAIYNHSREKNIWSAPTEINPMADVVEPIALVIHHDQICLLPISIYYLPIGRKQ